MPPSRWVHFDSILGQMLVPHKVHVRYHQNAALSVFFAFYFPHCAFPHLTSPVTITSWCLRNKCVRDTNLIPFFAGPQSENFPSDENAEHISSLLTHLAHVCLADY